MRTASSATRGAVISIALVASATPGLAGATTQYPTQSAAFASEVLGEATLPPGSQPTTAVVTQHLTTPPNLFQLHSSDGETYDANHLYTAPSPPATVVRYVEHHLPRGWKVAMTEPPDGPPPPGETIVQLEVPVAGPHQEAATVSYKVVPDGTGTEFRVDALVIWLPDRPLGLMAPPSGSILVTGYTNANLMGNPEKSTKVRVWGKRAAAIRRAFDNLPLSTPPHCMENSSDFALAFVPAGSKEPVLQAVQSACPSPGVVDVAQGPRVVASLASSCALARAVVSVLPAGRAPVTRQAVAHCHRG